MKASQKKELMRLTGEEILFDCPMERYTTLRAGGKAEALYKASRLEVLKRVLVFLTREHIPYEIVGRGSNLLVLEGGVQGVVIIPGGSLTQLDVHEEGKTFVDAGAGCSLRALVQYCSRKGLEGLEFLAGVPGSVGGAVAMNSGAFGQEVKDTVEYMDVLSPLGILERVEAVNAGFCYRGCGLDAGYIITEVRFHLKRTSPEDVSAKVSRNLEIRRENQPLDFPSAGSSFKNPPGDYAGRLIEEAGLKGQRIGGAAVSDRHANFIVNMGGATAADILNLIRLVRSRVNEKTGIELEPEIRIIGRE